MSILINIPIFLCILVTYTVLAVAVSTLPFMLAGLALSVAGFHRRPDKPRRAQVIARLSRWEVWFGMLFTAVYLVFHFRYRLWTSPHIQLWSSPLLFLALYLLSVVAAHSSSSPNPVLRQMFVMVRLSLIPTTILMIIGLTQSHLIAPWSIKWGIAGSMAIVLVANAIWGRANPAKLAKFESLEDRQNVLGAQIQQLIRISDAIGDTGKAKELSDLVKELDGRYSRARELLRQDRSSDAENLIIQSEIDVARVDETLSERIQYSLKDEVRARLEQTRADLEVLRGKFEGASISTEQIDGVSSRIDQELARLAGVSLSPEGLAEQLRPVGDIVSSIADMRAALRLRRNVGSQLDRIRREVRDCQLLLDMAPRLGLDTEVVAKSEKQILALLDDLQNQRPSSIQDLIDIYQDVQKRLTHFRGSVAMLWAAVDRHWHRTEGQFIACVPKSCTTYNPSTGVLVFKKGDEAVKEVNVTIDGILVEFETDRSFKMIPGGEGHYAVSPFNIVGKRAGLGRVILRCQELKELQTGLTFPVRIIPKVAELAQESFLYAVPFGGVTLVLLWWLGYNVAQYAGISAAAGGLFGLFLFGVRYLALTRHRQDIFEMPEKVGARV